MVRTLLLTLALSVAAADLTWGSVTPILDGNGHPGLVYQQPSRPLTDAEVSQIDAWNTDAPLSGAPYIYLGYPDGWTPPLAGEGWKIR